MEKGDIVYYYPETNRRTIARDIYYCEFESDPSFVLIGYPYSVKVSKCDIEQDINIATQKLLEQRLDKLESEVRDINHTLSVLVSQNKTLEKDSHRHFLR